ncbi:MAG: CHAT domain-containing protein [Ardenticatenaceae bacterium]
MKKFKLNKVTITLVAATAVLLISLALNAALLARRALFESSEPQVLAHVVSEAGMAPSSAYQSLSLAVLATQTPTSPPAESKSNPNLWSDPNLWVVDYPLIGLSPLPTVLGHVSLAENWPPIPADSPQLQALREAIFLLGEGDRLADAERTKEAREKWLAAVEAYQLAGERQGEAEVYLRLADSYQLEAIFDEQKWQPTLDYYLKALVLSAEVVDTLMQKEANFDEETVRQADARYKQGVELFQAGKCRQALPHLKQARDLYRSADFASGEIRALMSLARCQMESQEEYLGPLTTMQEALLIIERLPLGTPTSDLYLKGKEQYEQGDWQEAVNTLQEARQRYQAASNEVGVAQTSLDLGNLYAILGDHSQAGTLYQQALERFMVQKDHYNEAAASHNLANLAIQSERNAEAVAFYRTAIERWQQLDHPREKALSLSGLGLALRKQGDSTAALTAFQEALALQQGLSPDLESEGDLLNHIGTVYLAQGTPQEALDFFQQALNLRRQLPHRQKEAETLGNLAAVEVSLGRLEEALDNYQQILKLAAQIEQPILITTTHLNIAAIHILQGEYQTGIAKYLSGLDAESISADFTLGTTHLNLGTAYLQLGDLTSAESQLNQAWHIFQEIENPKGVAAAQSQLGMLMMAEDSDAEDSDAEDLNAAEAYFQQSLATWRTLDNPAAESFVQGNLALVAAERGDSQTALERAEATRLLSEQVKGPADKARLLLLVSTIHFKLGDYQATRNLAQQARQTDDSVTQRDRYLLLAMTNEATSKSIEAYDDLKIVMSRLDALQRGITVPELKTIFLSQWHNVYNLVVRLAIERNKPIEAFHYAEQARAQAFLNQLANGGIDFRMGVATPLLEREQMLRNKIAALRTQKNRHRSSTAQNSEAIVGVEKELTAREEDYTTQLTELKTQSPVITELVKPTVASLADVQTLLDANTTMVEYFVSEEQILAFVITDDSFEMLPLSVKPEALAERITNLRTIDFADLNNTHSANLQQLYTWLIAPLKPYLNTSALGIVSHDVLHDLPFAALSDGERYLNDDYVLFTLPSASAWQLLQAKQKPKRDTLLALGNPNTEEPVPHLSYLEKEVEAIANLYETEALVREQASESVLWSRAGEVSILHLAAVGQYNQRNPLFSTLYLSSGEGYDGRLELHEIYEGLTLTTTRLVVLSSSQTPTDAASDGDEIVNFSRAFLSAGATSVIDNLWSGDDQATAQLMTHFYTHLKEGRGQAEALRQAQLDVREEYPDPYYWAGFVLTGIPGEITAPWPSWPWVVGLSSLLGLTLGLAGLSFSSGLPPILLIRQKLQLFTVARSYSSYRDRWQRSSPLTQLILLRLSGKAVVDSEQLREVLVELNVPVESDQLELSAALREGLLRAVVGGYCLAEPQLADALQAHEGPNGLAVLAKQIRETHPLFINARRFLEKAGFTTLTLIEEPFLYCCEAMSVNWTTLLPSTVYVRLLPNHTLNGQQVRDIRDKVKGVDEGASIVFVITDQRPTYDGWGQIVTLGYESEPFTVLPIKSALINEGLATRNEETRLREEIDKRLGAHDPYNVTTPVRDFSFFGRDDLVKTLLRRITFGQPVGIFGLRKLGKTSVLHALQEQAPFPVALVSLETIGQDESLANLYQRIVNDLAQWTSVRLGIEWKPPLIIATEAPTGTFVRAIRDLLGRIKNVRGEARVGVFLDEIELIVPRPERRDSLTRYLSLLRPLRGLVDEGVNLSLVVAGLNPALNRIDDWDGERNPVFQLFQEIYLPPLDDEDCIQMVSSIGAQIRLQYSQESLQLISKLSGGHPFLARQLCSLLYKTHGDKNNAIRVSDVDNTVKRFIDDESTEIRLARIWQEAGNEKVWGAAKAEINQSVLLDLARADGSVAYDDLLDGPKRKARRTALINLERFHFVYQPQLGRYAIRFGLLEKWLRWLELGLD